MKGYKPAATGLGKRVGPQKPSADVGHAARRVSSAGKRMNPNLKKVKGK